MNEVKVACHPPNAPVVRNPHVRLQRSSALKCDTLQNTGRNNVGKHDAWNRSANDQFHSWASLSSPNSVQQHQRKQPANSPKHQTFVNLPPLTNVAPGPSFVVLSTRYEFGCQTGLVHTRPVLPIKVYTCWLLWHPSPSQRSAWAIRKAFFSTTSGQVATQIKSQNFLTAHSCARCINRDWYEPQYQVASSRLPLMKDGGF